MNKICIWVHVYQKKKTEDRPRKLFRFHSVPRSHTAHGRLHIPLQPFETQAWPMIGAIARGARGQRIRYCQKPDFAVMYADGQCAHYRTNSGKGLQVLRPDLPYSLSVSLSSLLFFSSWSVNEGTEGEAVTGITLLAQTEGPTRWPRGIRKLAKPDLLVSFTCLTRSLAYSRSLFALLILHPPSGRHWAPVHSPKGYKHEFAAHLYTHLPAYTYIHVLFILVLLKGPLRDIPRVYTWVSQYTLRQTTINSVRTGYRCYTRCSWE